MTIPPNRSMSNALGISGVAILAGTQLSWTNVTVAGTDIGSESAHDAIYHGLPLTILGILVLILGFTLATVKIHAGNSMFGLPIAAGVLYYLALDLRQIHDINEVMTSSQVSVTPGLGLIITLLGAVAATMFSILAYTARSDKAAKGPRRGSGPGPGVSSSDSGATVAPSLY